MNRCLNLNYAFAMKNKVKRGETMKKLSKLMALLLALAIVFSLAACGGKADDKGSSDANNGDKAQQTEPTEVSDPEPLAGTWEYRIEISKDLIKSIDSEAFQESYQQNISSPKEVYLDLKLEFADGKLTITGDMDEKFYTDFRIDVTIAELYASAAQWQNMDKAAYDEDFQQKNGMTVAQYAENQVKLNVAQEGAPHMETEAKYYKVDESAGKIYLAETEDSLETGKECIDYTLADGKLTLKKFYDEKGKETAAPLDVEYVAALPWTFEKK